MVKTRMGLLDLRVQTSALHNCLRGARVTNIYDAQNGRTYILKLSVPPSRVQHTQTDSPTTSSTEIQSSSSQQSSSATWEKRLLLLESGVRVHMTQFDREKDVPSGFCLKLRKHIRARRLDAIQQLGDGGDRILDLVFSAEGQTSAHLIVEAFSGGNIILTDKDYTILTLLRTYRVSNTENDARVAVRERYPVEGARRQAKIDKPEFQAAAKRILDNLPDEQTISAASGRGARKRLLAMGFAKRALAVELSLEPSLIEHALLEAGLEADVSVNDLHKGDGVERTFQSLQEVEEDISRLLKRGQLNGYIVSTVKNVDGESREEYNEFAPYLFAQYRKKPYKSFDSFDEAADEFFSSLEASRAEATKTKRENAAFKKVDKLAAELHGQVAVFENARDMSWERAQAIERNVVEVEAAITVIRSAIAASVPWEGLSKMIEDEKKSGNPVAEIIHSLQLKKNEITLMLEDSFGSDEEEKCSSDDEDGDRNEKKNNEPSAEDSDESDGYEHSQPSGGMFRASAETRKVLLVSVDLDLGAHANARRHYELRKNAAEKMEKAAEATGRTLKAATRKAVTEAHKLEAQTAAATIKARRKAHWFEKFYWFVSSENYLIVAGRDPQQNDLLVKRYLGPADVYVHADVQGASSVIVKNRKLPGCTSHSEIPQMTLEQAGTFAMCRSTAWDAKIVTSAWWVRAGQVSKTAPSGDYLPSGSFSIRGKKKFLTPAHLMMGLAFLFKVEESCVANHKGERAVRGLDLLQAVKQDDKLHAAHVSPQPNEKVTGDSLPDDPRIKAKGMEDSPAEHSFQSPGDSLASHNEDDPGHVSKEDEASAENDQIESKGSDELSNDRGNAKEPKAPRANKRHLSAKQRRELRNARNASSDEAQTEQEKPLENAGPAVTVEKKQQDHNNASASKSNAPLPRGRKHKLKKMKKYKDQDDEERRIALTVLGSKPIKEQDAASHSSNIVEDEKVEGEADDEDKAANVPNPKARREERQEVMRLLDEEGIIELGRLERETVTTLDMLTASPIPEDKVQYALPVCAPYSALSNYRYKVKLMPGNTKRGKAYRAAVALFIRQAEKDLTTCKQERDSLRISPENDGIHGMLGNVKVMAPGFAEAQKSIQKNKKSAASKKTKRKG